MWRHRGLALVAALGVALSSLSSIVNAGDETLCAIAPGTYAAAKSSNPEMAFAIAELEKHAVATWYSDRLDNGDYGATARQIVATCPPSSRMTIVVYGLPNKDCEAKESMVGTRNKNSGMYQEFVSSLHQTVGDRKVLYIVEPDAIALLAKGGCAKEFGYGDNLAIAVRTLSKNPNADIYLDVGHWMLSGGSDLSGVASIVRNLASMGRVKGITINTSNYRSSAELSGLCSKFRSATSGLDLHCIIDTSRNYNGPSSQDEWCNFKNAAVGRVPTGKTGDPNIDYYVWIKPPGESDGTCSGRTSDAMYGPGAGKFFPAFMKQMWNNGALVKEMGMPMIDGSIRPVQQQSTTPAPTTGPSPTQAPAPAPTPSPSATVTPSPTPSSSAQQQQTDTTAEEGRSIDTANLNFNNTSASSTASSGATEESGGVAASVIAAPIEKDPVFENAPEPTASQASEPAGQEETQASTKSSAGGAMSTGIVVLGCLIGAAVVALVAVVAVRVRQRSLEENKSPMDPRIHYLSNSPTSVATL